MEKKENPNNQKKKPFLQKKNQPNTELTPVDVAHEDTTSEDLKKQFLAKGKIINLDGFLTHAGVHNDELASISMILNSEEGKKRFSFKPGGYGIYFPGEKGLNKRYLGPDGFFEALEDGYLLIGTGNGHYDEHGKRDKSQSCAALVATDLGITENPESVYLFSRILKYVNYEDTHGSNFRDLFINPEMAQTFGFGLLADNVKAGVFAAQGDDDLMSDVVKGALQFMKNEIDSQRLQQQGRELYREAKKNAQSYPLPVDKIEGRDVILFVLHTDSEVVTKHAVKAFKTAEKERLGILMNINSKGQLYLRPLNGVKLDEVVKILRIQIAQKRKLASSVKWADLTKDGSLESSPDLYVHKSADGKIVHVMNGSPTHPEVPGLVGPVLTEADILFAIRTGLNTKKFANEHQAGCQGGTCAKKANGSFCSFGSYGLQRCFDIRSNMEGGATIAAHLQAKTENKQGSGKGNVEQRNSNHKS